MDEGPIATQEGGCAEWNPISYSPSVVFGNAEGTWRNTAALHVIAGADEMGRPYWFRRRLDRLDEGYLLVIASNTQVRDLRADSPPYSGYGRKPKRPWTRVDRWTASRADDDWTEIDVRDGAKGPLVVEVVKRCVVARTNKRQEGHEEVLVVIRYRDRNNRKVVKTDYYLSNASPDTQETECAYAAKAKHRIEECIQRSEIQAGLADYEVRNWKGWHHHQILSLIATWFLVTEARRGKNGLRQSRFHKSEKVSVPSFTASADAVFLLASHVDASNDSLATNSLAFTIGNSVIS